MKKTITFFLIVFLSSCGGGGGGNGGGSSSSGNSTLLVNNLVNNNPDWVVISSSDAEVYKTTEYNNQNYLATIQAAEAYAELAANSKDVGGNSATRIAVIDTGVQSDHIEISGNYLSNLGYDFVNNDSDAEDDEGHGTNVASIAAGVKDGSGIHGVAFNSKIISIKNLDETGSGNFSDFVSSVDQAVSDGASVINMSLGGSSTISSVKTALLNAKDNDVLSVAAAGNDGDGTVDLSETNYPANYASDPDLAGFVLAVVATNSANEIATIAEDGYNSYHCGDNMNYCLAAPGVDVIGAFYSETSNSTYASASGTSQATPLVAGAAAVLRAAWPHLTADETADILLKTATDLGATGVDEIYGYGLLNLHRAVQAQGQDSFSFGLTVSSGGYSISQTSISTDPIFGDAFFVNVASKLADAVYFDSYGRDFKANLASKISLNSNSNTATNNLQNMAFNNVATEIIPINFNQNLSNLKLQFSSYQNSSAQNSLGLKFATIDKASEEKNLQNSTAFSFIQNNKFFSDKKFKFGFAFNLDELSNQKDSENNDLGFLTIRNFSANPYQQFLVSNNQNLPNNQNQNYRNFNQLFVETELFKNFYTNFSLQNSYDNSAISSSLQNQQNRISDVGFSYSLAEKTKINLSLGNLEEFDNNLLNSKSSGAFESSDNVKTSYLKITLNQKIVKNLSSILSFAEGRTSVKGNEKGIFRDFSDIKSRSFSFGLVNKDAENFDFGLLYSLPMRVYQGTAKYDVAVGRDNAGNLYRERGLVSLAPNGKQQDYEFFLTKKLAIKNLDQAMLKFNFIYQQEANNIEDVEDSFLGFISLRSNF